MKEAMTLNDWPGSNYFCLNGRCVAGAHGIKAIIFTATMFPIPIALFLAYYWQFLVNKFTWASFVVPIALFIPAIVLFFMTGLSDPGVMRRNTEIHGSHEVVIKVVHLGRLLKTRICLTCQTVKPFRSAHCADCDNCVMNFDHHCPWIGNCVGLRNYVYFYIFVIILNVESWYIGAFAIANIALTLIEEESKLNGLANCIVSLIVVIYILIEMIFITGLFFYHTMLIFTNRSTKDEIKKLLVSPIGNIYDRGICANIRSICCRQKPKISTIRAIGMTVQSGSQIQPQKPKQKQRKVEIRPYQDHDAQVSSTRKMKQENASCSSFYGRVNEISDSNLSLSNMRKRVCNTSFQNSKNDNSLLKKELTLTESEDSIQMNFKLKQLPTEISVPKENSCDVLINS